MGAKVVVDGQRCRCLAECSHIYDVVIFFIGARPSGQPLGSGRTPSHRERSIDHLIELAGRSAHRHQTQPYWTVIGWRYRFKSCAYKAASDEKTWRRAAAAAATARERTPASRFRRFIYKKMTRKIVTRSIYGMPRFSRPSPPLHSSTSVYAETIPGQSTAVDEMTDDGQRSC